jgi:hypothetical protein
MREEISRTSVSNPKGRCNLQGVNIDGRIILEWILEKQDVERL